MGRRSAQDKAQTHQKIVEHAAQAFRQQGAGVGIGELMQDLGLTHGGFYRHFESKDALFVEAVSQALDEIAARLDGVARQAPPGGALEAMVTAYLSEDHLHHPETWCALAAMAPDIARQSEEVRQGLADALLRYMGRLAPYLPGTDDRTRQNTFLLLFSGMAGTVAMARLIPDAGMRRGLLSVARGHYLEVFGSPA